MDNLITQITNNKIGEIACYKSYYKNGNILSCYPINKNLNLSFYIFKKKDEEDFKICSYKDFEISCIDINKELVKSMQTETSLSIQIKDFIRDFNKF